jgi:hypothetical protein
MGKILDSKDLTFFEMVVWNMNFIFPYIGNFIIPADFHIFQRGRYTTNQSFRNGGLLGLNGTLNGEWDILENHQTWLGNL